MKKVTVLSILGLIIVIGLVIVIVILSNISDSSNQNRKDLETLQLIHVIFRHGDRTNDKFTVYPNDPHKDYSYEPYGYGRLTNKGKLKVYDAGRELHEKYGNFLKLNNPEDVIYARSTASPRAIVSMQLFLAGLFPPTYLFTWKHNLLWNPLPFIVIPTRYDKLLQGYKCPNYRKIYKEYTTSVENLMDLQNFTETFEYISNHTGWNIKNFEDAALVKCGLEIEEEFGLILPEWTKTIWPEPIKTAQHQYYYEMTANNLMMKYTIGFFLEEILRNTKAKIANDTVDERKIFIYSAHDYNIGFFLRALNVLDRPRNPKYASYIILELHKIDDAYSYKVYYQNYNYDKLELLEIPNCGILCPIDKFKILINDYLPDDGLKCGTEDECDL